MRKKASSTTTVPPLTQPVLHEAALEYLSHRSASVAQMKKVLARRIAAWARRVGEEADVSGPEAAAAAVVERLLASGLLNDAAFAERRAGALTRAGKSRRAVAFDLKTKGVSEANARAVVPQDAETELSAAVVLMRKKRMGPYARVTPDDKTKKRWLGAFARGGFSFATAQRALRLDRESADEMIRQLR